jgi:hypothetical protein
VRSRPATPSRDSGSIKVSPCMRGSTCAGACSSVLVVVPPCAPGSTSVIMFLMVAVTVPRAHEGSSLLGATRLFSGFSAV